LNPSLSYFYGFKNAVIEVWKARILVHHAVDEFCKGHHSSKTSQAVLYEGPPGINDRGDIIHHIEMIIKC